MIMSNLINITDKSPLTHITKKINGEKVTIKTYLSIGEFVNAVHTIADLCFVEDETTHKVVFKPEYRDIAWRYMVLQYFTDIDLSEVSIDEVFKVTQSDWYAEIERICAENPVYCEISKADDSVIAMRQKSAFDNLCDNLSAIIATDPSQNLADIKDVLDKLGAVDPKAFVEAAVENNIEKNK